MYEEYQMAIKYSNRSTVDAGDWEKYNAMVEKNDGNIPDWQKIIADYQELVKTYSSIRREIDETIKSIGGLKASIFDVVKTAISNLKPLYEKIKKNVINPIKKFEQLSSKITNGVTKVMWSMEPVHKMLNRLGQSLHSLWVRVKRVLVYSTIVSFFRTIKNQISAFLQQNEELMGALGKAKGAWMTAFMPIYNFVVPKIIALINWLEVLGAKIATLTARIFGGSVGASKAQAKALQEEAKAAGGAAKAYEAQLAAFDELNILKEDKGGGGGSSEDLAAPDFDFEEQDMQDYLKWYDWLYDKASKCVDIFKKFGEWLDKAADSINDFGKNLFQTFRGDNVDMAQAMLDKFKEIGTTLATGLNNAIKKINWKKLGQALGAGIDLALATLVSFIKKFDWVNLGNSIATFLNGAISQINWRNVGELLVAKFNIAWKTLKGLIKTLDWKAIGNAVGDAMMGAIKNIDIASRIQAIVAFIKGIIQALLNAVKTSNVAEVAAQIFAKITEGLIRSIPDMLKIGVMIIQGLIQGMLNMVVAIASAILGIVQGIINAFKKPLGIQSPSTVMMGIGANIIQGLLLGLQNAWANITSWVSTATTALKTAFTNMATGIKGAFTTLKDGLLGTLALIKQGFSSAWGNVVETAKAKFDSLVSNIGEAVGKIGDALSNMGSKLGTGITNAWSKITNFVTMAKNKLSGVKIPTLASGGVITKPTVAMMGEYSGASSNPEIVAPESLLRGIMAESNDDVADTLISVGRQIIEAINNNNTEIRIGDDVISAAAARGAKDYKKRTGMNQFA